MNKARRNKIKDLITGLDSLDLMNQIQSILDDESSYYEEMPEGLQNGEKGEAAQAAIDELQTAFEAAENLIGALQNAGE